MPLHESPQFKAYLSGSDAIALLEIVHGSLACKTGQDFLTLFPKLEKLFPFDFAHAMLGYQDRQKKIVIDHALNISFPEEWVSEFISRDYMQVAVVIRNNFMNYGLQHWPDTKKRLNEKKEVLSLFNDFDMSNGYSHGSRSSRIRNCRKRLCRIRTRFHPGPEVSFEICTGSITAALLQVIMANRGYIASSCFGPVPFVCNRTTSDICDLYYR